MKKILIPLVFFAANANAVIDGQQLNWSDYNNLTRFSCTGTVIGNNWIITANHCKSTDNVIFNFDTDEYQNTSITTSKRIEEPTGLDVVLLKLSRPVTKVNIFTPLGLDFKINDKASLYGFGHRGNGLAKANLKIISSTLDTEIAMKSIGEGEGEHGDSGGPIISNGKMVAVYYGWREDTLGGIKINAIQDYITTNINAWHYPTAAKFTGKKIITVQSLHVNDVSDSAYSDGDITITGGTCLGASNIKPFDTCTYEIQSNGGKGRLYLTPDEHILINEQVKPTPELQPDTGKSGGSFGYLGLFSLLGLSFYRRKKTISAK